jgi:hypothetical protein
MTCNNPNFEKYVCPRPFMMMTRKRQAATYICHNGQQCKLINIFIYANIQALKTSCLKFFLLPQGTLEGIIHSLKLPGWDVPSQTLPGGDPPHVVVTSIFANMFAKMFANIRDDCEHVRSRDYMNISPNVFLIYIFANV